MGRILKRWRIRFLRTVILPVVFSLRRGTSPHKVTLTIVLGLTIGLIPVIGISTAILIALAVHMKLNMIIIQIANFVVYPLHILFYIPFFKLGLLLHPSENAPNTFHEFFMMARESWTGALVYFGSATLFAVLAWFLVAMPLGIMLYNALYLFFKKRVTVRTR